MRLPVTIVVLTHVRRCLAATTEVEEQLNRSTTSGVVKRASLVAVSLVLVLASSGCGRESDKPIIAGAGSQAGASNVAASPEWAREGERLRQFKAEKNQQRGGRALPGNADDFAYQSQPIDIVKAGDCVLLVKVPDAFDFPRSPSVVVVNYPDDSREHFGVNNSGPMSVRSDGVARVLEVPVKVTEFRSAYSGYSIWIY